jgi:hypothetical protein
VSGGVAAVVAGTGLVVADYFIDKYITGESTKFGPLTPDDQKIEQEIKRLEREIDSITGDEAGGPTT